MCKSGSKRNLQQDVADLLLQDKGFCVHRAFLADAEADQYRQECEAFLTSGPRLDKWPGYGRDRINRDRVPDYVFSRPHSHSTRIYQFPANPHSPSTKAIFDKALSVRNIIEAHWLDDSEYQRILATQCDYVQVSRYLWGQAIDKHSDSPLVTPYPLVQCVVLMSQPGTDFTGGELILYSRSGRSIQTNADLAMKKGDALFFDKSLIHEVQTTEPAGSNEVGRWSAVIGGRVGRPNGLRRLTRRVSQWAVDKFPISSR